MCSGYHYEIELRSTHHHCIAADVLSRPSLDVKDSNNGSEAILFNIYQIETLLVLAPEIQKATHHAVLSLMFHFTQNGFPEHVFGQLKIFHAMQFEITEEEDCLLWSVRVIIPKCLQNLTLRELHQNHLGTLE